MRVLTDRIRKQAIEDPKLSVIVSIKDCRQSSFLGKTSIEK
jgi:hypothetical protein